MPIKNSFISLTNQIETLMNNSMSVLTGLTEIVESNSSQIDVKYNNNNEIASFPTVGNLKKQLESLQNQLNTLSSVDQRGSILRNISGKDKKIITVDLNREPNQIPELQLIDKFIPQNNWFFDSLLNPLLNVRIDLSDKIESNVRKVLSRRYIINFDVNEFGDLTDVGLNAQEIFNNTFKNRTDITITELESFLTNTDGVSPDARGKYIKYDEQIFELNANQLQYEGYFTILGVFEDSLNKKQLYEIDTLEYYEVSTNTKRQLQINDELIINVEYSTTRYRVIEINTEASEYRVRLERIEGYDPIPVGITYGMKFYSDIIENKEVDISVGFDEYNVIFLKAINTENNLVCRNWSTGVAYYTNDLTLKSSESLNEDGKTMQDFYINTIRDYGVLLKDMVDRFIPRRKGIKPDSPILLPENFRVRQNNKYLTDTPNLEELRKKHKNIREIRSKIDETSKLVQQKRNELYSKNFRSPKDKINVENQISKLTKQIESDTVLLNSTVTDIISNQQNNIINQPSYIVEGCWELPNGKTNNKSRIQEVIGFKIQYKYTNLDGKGDENETFKLTNINGDVVNAVISPWITLQSSIRERVYDINTQKFIWKEENLSSIDDDNINSIQLPIVPNQQITVRIKSISEVGYPDSILESDWSEELTITFDDELLQGRNPELQFQKNAELEELRNNIVSDFDRLGLSQHLSDSVVNKNIYYPHLASDLGFQSQDGSIIPLTEKIKSIENDDNVEQEKDITLTEYWTTFNKNYSSAKYYKHNNRVYLGGVLKVDKGEDITNIVARFPKVNISNTQNSEYSIIGQLPENYRPINTKMFSVISGTNIGRIDITPDGIIKIIIGNSGMVNLDNISFRI